MGHHQDGPGSPVHGGFIGGVIAHVVVVDHKWILQCCKLILIIQCQSQSLSLWFEIDKRLIHLVARRFPRIGNKLFYNISQILSLRLKKNITL